jgi:photosystem II stability/assembly factor-like uncharacterized protein
MLRLNHVMAALLLPAALLVQFPAHAGNTEEALEGNGDARDAYFAQRRQGPNVNFDAAAARQAAANLKISAKPMSALPAAYQHAEVWEAIGPAPLVGGQTPTFPFIPSPVSGRVSSIAIDAQDGAVFVGGAQGGVWRSNNNGQTWQALTDNLGSLSVGQIVIAPGVHGRNQATIYLGTGEGNFSGDSYSGGGIYKSTDSGHTWQGPFGFAQFHGRSVSTLAVDSTNANNILAGSSTGVCAVSGLNPCGAGLANRAVYRSIDGGQTWTQVLPTSGTQRASRILQDPNNSLRFWAAMAPLTGNGTNGLFVSNDSGATWSAVDGVATGLPVADLADNGGFVRGYIALVNNGGTTVVYYATSEVPASQAATGNGGTLYVSTDGGTTFANVPGADGFCQGQCTYDMPIAVDSISANVVYTGGAGTSDTSDGTNTGTELIPSQFMRSNNGLSGATATFTSHVRSGDQSTALHADVHAITPWPGHANEVWVGNDGGIWQSVDGGNNWINHNTTLQITQFSGCDMDPLDRNRAYGGTQDNGTNGWSGSVGWPHVDFGDGGFALIDQVNPNNLVHTYYNQTANLLGVGYTTAGFATTQGNYDGSFADDPATTTDGNGIGFNDRVLFYAPLHLDRGVHDTLYYGTNKLYKADTFFSFPNQTPNIFTALGTGATGQDLAPPNGALSAIETVASIGMDAQTIYTGSSNGHVFKSTNGGVSFSELDNVPGAIAQYVSDIVVNPRNALIVFEARAGFTGAVPSHSVRKSIDGGLTWGDASIGLPDIPVNALSFDPVAPNTIWAGTDVGVFLSSDGGATWNPYSNGLPNVAIFDIKSNHATDSILVCTHGRGAYRLSLDAIFIDGFESN